MACRKCVNMYTACRRGSNYDFTVGEELYWRSAKRGYLFTSLNGKYYTGNMNSEVIEDYMQALYAIRRTGNKVAPIFLYQEVAEYFSKNPKFAERDEMRHRPTALLPRRQ